MYSFRTRSNSFSFRLNDLWSHVIIQESYLGRTFNLSLDVNGCKWISNQLSQTMEKRHVEERVRTFRKDNYRLCLIRGENKAGEFMKLMKVEDGKVNSLVIPKEKDGVGWSNFYVYIKGFFVGNKQKGIYIGRTRDGSVTNGENKVDFVKIKDWNKAVTIFRSNTRMHWREISRKLENLIKRKAEVRQVSVDRAIFWCFEVKELDNLLMKPEILSSNHTYVNMKKWQKEDH